MNSLAITTSEYFVQVNVPNGAAYSISREKIDWNRNKENPQIYAEAAIFLAAEGRIQVLQDDVRKLCEEAL